MKKIWDYFENNVEYPHEVIHNPIPYNTVWTYISSTYLNGLVNYLTPIKIYLIDRYTPDSEVISDRHVSYRLIEKGNSFSWQKFTGTKGELKELFLSGEIDFYHTHMDCFADDIVILAEFEHNEIDGLGRYMFLWYDMDCSDCSVGKFVTSDTKEQVIQSIQNWLEAERKENGYKEVLEHYDNGIVNYTELPNSFMSGWVKF